MNAKSIVSLIAIALLCGCHFNPTNESVEHKPNVLVVLTDDMGWGMWVPTVTLQ